MAAKKTSPAMEFIVDALKKNKKAEYSDIKAAAEKKGLEIYPIMFGRAQALLGIVKSAPRGQGKAARAKKGLPPLAAAPVVKRGPGRPRKNPLPVAAASTDLSSLDGIIQAVKGTQQERERMRNALVKIQAILADALS